MASDNKVQKLRRLKEESKLAGGTEAVGRQHERGKMTARERLAALLDEGSFQEIDALVTHHVHDFGLQERVTPGDGVVTGYGTIEGRLVYVSAQDFTVMGGSLGNAHAAKITKVQDLALKTGAPFISINDSGGARIQEGIRSLAGYGDIFLRNTLASGVIPQISIIMGPCAGGAVYSPALTDFTFMVKGTSHMFITGPQVVKTATHEEVTFEELGGAMTHNRESGVAHFAAEDEQDCLQMVRKLMGYLPQNNMEDPPAIASQDNPARADEALDTLVPENPNAPYDMKQVITRVIDTGSFLEVQEHHAPNVVIGFARLDGAVVGIVANQPAAMAGVLDIDASIKAARFVRFLDAFNIPIITFEDVPGFMPGVNQEHGGIIRHGAKLIFAYCEATVPKLTVITRKAYGGAYIVMSSKHTRGDYNVAWPTAELAVLGADEAVNVIYRRELESASDAGTLRTRLTAEYREKFANPYLAASYGYLDDVIEPSQTRAVLINALQMLQNKRDDNPPKKHGNMPL
ncbi:MAG: methylmalonyl-CoA carboxyltransferase [Chloroflexi bacterium RBG_13_56_8]|nr:MAG: methylmalonyl-CoA carboxyltransferase [Chloroflexi bacterium RBG_13_56_8]